jgi:outer membrane protein OmpA-like peptidoglycan-associated protein
MVRKATFAVRVAAASALLICLGALPAPRPAGAQSAPPPTGGHTDGVQQPQGNWQKPGDIQQPKGSWQQPGNIQVPHGIQAIKAQSSTCEQRLSVVADALFAFDQATLSAEAAETLDALGPQIARAGQHPVVIEGHTDAIGTDAHNQRLSEQRAAAVRAWLVAHHFVAAGTPIKGHGKTRPAAPNTNPDGSDNPAGRARNRRVEVVIRTCP